MQQVFYREPYAAEITAYTALRTPPPSAFNTRRRSALKALIRYGMPLRHLYEFGWNHVFDVPCELILAWDFLIRDVRRLCRLLPFV